MKQKINDGTGHRSNTEMREAIGYKKPPRIDSRSSKRMSAFSRSVQVNWMICVSVLVGRKGLHFFAAYLAAI